MKNGEGQKKVAEGWRTFCAVALTDEDGLFASTAASLGTV